MGKGANPRDRLALCPLYTVIFFICVSKAKFETLFFHFFHGTTDKDCQGNLKEGEHSVGPTACIKESARIEAMSWDSSPKPVISFDLSPQTSLQCFKVDSSRTWRFSAVQQSRVAILQYLPSCRLLRTEWVFQCTRECATWGCNRMLCFNSSRSGDFSWWIWEQILSSLNFGRVLRLINSLVMSYFNVVEKWTCIRCCCQQFWRMMATWTEGNLSDQFVCDRSACCWRACLNCRR